MLVVIPSWSGDYDRAEALAATIRRSQSSSYRALRPHRDQHGNVRDGLTGEFVGVATNKDGVHGKTSLFKLVARWLPLNEWYLWLEPDCTLSRSTALEEMQRELSRLDTLDSRLCCVGHWLSTVNEMPAHMSQVAAYKATTVFKEAAAKCRPMRLWNMDLTFYGRLKPDMMTQTDLIACAKHGKTAQYETAAIRHQ